VPEIKDRKNTMDLQAVDDIIKEHRDSIGGVLSILSGIQLTCGYLPEDALRRVAQSTGQALTDIYAVSTFYRAFSLKPRGKHMITICLGTACHVREAPRIVDEFERQLRIRRGETTADGEFTLETVNCLGACALGPIAVVDGKYYSQVTVAQVKSIIQETAGSGNAQERHAHEAGATRDALSITGTVHGNGI
jgi:NADH-quinone oxidoreductase subunit E